MAMAGGVRLLFDSCPPSSIVSCKQCLQFCKASPKQCDHFVRMLAAQSPLITAQANIACCLGGTSHYHTCPTASQHLLVNSRAAHAVMDTSMQLTPPAFAEHDRAVTGRMHMSLMSQSSRADEGMQQSVTRQATKCTLLWLLSCNCDGPAQRVKSALRAHFLRGFFCKDTAVAIRCRPIQAPAS
jgi:hypothetical protein